MLSQSRSHQRGRLSETVAMFTSPDPQQGLYWNVVLCNILTSDSQLPLSTFETAHRHTRVDVGSIFLHHIETMSRGAIREDVGKAIRSTHLTVAVADKRLHLRRGDGLPRWRLLKASWVRSNGASRQRPAAPQREQRVVLAIGSIGDGFDDSRLDALFLAMPISWEGTLQQYMGRLHRLT